MKSLDKIRSAFINFRIELLSMALLTVLVLLIAPAIIHVGTPDSDYDLHAELIRQLVTGENGLPTFLARVPHFLFHAVVIAGYWISPATPLLSIVLVVSILFYILGVWAVFLLFQVYVGRPTTYKMSLLYVAMTMIAVIVIPANIFTPTNLYLGYMTGNIYHNPTIIALKPFSIVLFLLAGRIFEPLYARMPKKWLILFIVMSVLSLLAKPNYILVLLPALVVLTALQLWRRGQVNWVFLLAGILIPAGVVLGLQSLLLGSRVTLVFAPLAVVNKWAEMFNPLANQAVVLKLVLSVLFPLVIYLTHFRTASRDIYLNLAWITWIFGAALYYLFAEEGVRLSHGNLTWSAQIAVFILFAASLAFFVRVYRAGFTRANLTSPVFLLCSGVLMLHIISGIYWYSVHLWMTPSEIYYGVW